MKLNQDQLDQIAGVQETLELYFDYLPDITQTGKVYMARCPFHNDSRASFNIYYSDDKYLFKCFSCGVCGNIFQFLSKIEGISFDAAVKMVNSAVEGSWEHITKQVDKVFTPVLPITEQKKTYSMEEYAKYETDLHNNPTALDWLSTRGLSIDTVKKLHLGYVQERKFYKLKPELADKGWISFPYIHNEAVTAVKFRSIYEKAFDQISGMSTSLYCASDIDLFDTVYLVEGELDAAVMIQAGFTAISLPSAGYKLTPEDRDFLLSGNQLILAGDADEPGTKCMMQIQRELNLPRVHYLKWPDAIKDANQFFLEHCHGDIETFQREIKQLTILAKTQVMKDITDMKEFLSSGEDLSLQDDPHRLRFPWKSVDNMAILVPGSILCLFAAVTGQGKTLFTMNFTLDDAIKHDERVLNYQCELDNREFGNMMVAFLLKKDRNTLTTEDSKLASQRMGNARYYVGRNTELNRLGPVLDLIENAIKRLGITIAVLDHIHFICRNESNEVQALANGMQRIKRMAQKYGTKFVVVGQPRKADQKNYGKVPLMSEAKGSETFSSDADTLFILRRKLKTNIDPANPPRDLYENKTEVYCHKTRSKGNGNAFAILTLIGEKSTFYDPTLLESDEKQL